MLIRLRSAHRSVARHSAAVLLGIVGPTMSFTPKSADVGTELSLRSLVLGVLITLVFTAANVYFGLKAGLTFATSIPAAVISMAVLRGF